MGDIADDRLPTGINVDVFNDYFLPATAPHVRQRVHLGCERPLRRHVGTAARSALGAGILPGSLGYPAQLSLSRHLQIITSGGRRPFGWKIFPSS